MFGVYTTFRPGILGTFSSAWSLTSWARGRVLCQRDQAAQVGGGSFVEAMEDHAVTGCVEFVAFKVADEVRAVGR